MTFAVLTPAKLNLGLEVLGKRDDGYHDIATVFQSISLFDRIHLERADRDEVRLLGSAEQLESNLAERALDVLRDAGNAIGHWNIRISKRIPMAAGLGGASSDAAAVLVTLGQQVAIPPASLEKLALRLGSDVPFLLSGGTVRAAGRGDQLDRLPPLRNCWFVLATPPLALDRKTTQLYGALQPVDFTDGSRIDLVAAAIRQGTLPEPSALKNAFERPLHALLPEIAELERAFSTAGAPFVALSGAGPTHYAIVQRLSEAISLARALRAVVPHPTRIMIARPTAYGPLVQLGRTTPSLRTL